MGASALTVVMSHIFNKIPDEILDLAFRTSGGIGSSTTIDEKIKEEVIVGRILNDVNATCGRPALIPMLAEYRETGREIRTAFLGPTLLGDLYRIPPAAREGRDITAVREIMYSMSYSQYSGSHPGTFGDMGNTMGNMMDMALKSRTLADGNKTPTPILREGNIIQVTPRIISEGLMLSCTLGYDDEFTNLPAGQYQPLRDMAVTATKGMIYNKLAVRIDSAQLQAGAPLGIIRDIVSRYEQEGSDAVYDEHLKKFRGGMGYDPEVFKHFLRAAL